MSSPILIVLTGLPAAGKSFFATRLGLELFDRHGIQSMIIASDTVRSEIPALSRGFLPSLEAPVRQMTLERVESGLSQGLSVIHDDLNYYRSMRFELLDLARKLEVAHALIHVATPVKQCLAFNEKRGFKVPDEVIRKDHERFDPPGLDPWDQPMASIIPPGPSDWELSAIAVETVSRAADYVPPKPPSLAEHLPTREEAVDLLSRRVVGALYRAHPRRPDGKAVSRLRQELAARAILQGLSLTEAEALFRQDLGALFESVP